jgi:hypothetical protein
MAETLSRLAACERENADQKSEIAALRSENERLRGQLMQWDPHFLLRFDLPSAEQALELWRKITSKYPQMKSWSDSETDQAMGMTAAMGFLFASCVKTEKPNSRYGGDWWLARADEWARTARIPYSRIRTVLAAVIATNDVAYHLSNLSIGIGTGPLIGVQKGPL